MERILYYISAIEQLILLFIIKKYLFLECENEKKRRRTFILSILLIVTEIIALIVVGVLERSGMEQEQLDYYCNLVDELIMLLPVFIVLISAVSCRKKGKIFGVFLTIPLMGYLDIVTMLPKMALYQFSNADRMICFFVEYSIPLSILGCIYLLKPKWYISYKESIETSQIFNIN